MKVSQDMRNGKINSPRLRVRVVELVRKTGQPVSMLYVAEHLNLAWTTARAILFDLSLNGQLKAIKTTKSWIFQLHEVSPESAQAPNHKIDERR